MAYRVPLLVDGEAVLCSVDPTHCVHVGAAEYRIRRSGDMLTGADGLPYAHMTEGPHDSVVGAYVTRDGRLVVFRVGRGIAAADADARLDGMHPFRRFARITCKTSGEYTYVAIVAGAAGHTAGGTWFWRVDWSEMAMEFLGACELPPALAAQPWTTVSGGKIAYAVHRAPAGIVPREVACAFVDACPWGATVHLDGETRELAFFNELIGCLVCIAGNGLVASKVRLGSGKGAGTVLARDAVTKAYIVWLIDDGMVVAVLADEKVIQRETGEGALLGVVFTAPDTAVVFFGEHTVELPLGGE